MDHYTVRIRSSTWDLLRDLQRLHDLDVFSKTAKQLDDHLVEIDVLLSDEQIEYLSKKGYQIETIAAAGEVAKERMKDVPGLSTLLGDQSDNCKARTEKYEYLDKHSEVNNCPDYI